MRRPAIGICNDHGLSRLGEHMHFNISVDSWSSSSRGGRSLSDSFPSSIAFSRRLFDLVSWRRFLTGSCSLSTVFDVDSWPDKSLLPSVGCSEVVMVMVLSTESGVERIAAGDRDRPADPESRVLPEARRLCVGGDIQEQNG